MLRLLAGAVLVVCAAAHAQPAPPPAASAASPASDAQQQLPALRDMQGLVPRPVRAASALLGMGRQRLALVVGLGTVGGQRVLESAARDTQAVATALRGSGFVVMQRDDVVAADLQASLHEFHDRLQPGALGFVYVTGLAVQLDGQNLLLPRDTTLATGTPATQLRAAGVPLADVLAALAGTPDSPRLLVVDAAYRHPALAAVAAPGLAEPRLPPGTMALFSHAPGSLHETTAAVPLPTPAPADARDIAASAFARTLVGALLTPRTSGPDALRATRRAVFDASQGQDNPWLGGDTDSREELAEADLLDSMVPRTPEEMARETARQGARLLGKPAGEQSVAQILQQSAAAPPGQAAAVSGNGGGGAAQGSAADRSASASADNTNTSSGNSSAGSTLGTAVSAVGTVAAVASAAATVANIGAGIKRAETDAATSLATSAAQTGVALAGSAAATLLRAAAGTAPPTTAAAAAPSVATATAGVAPVAPAATAVPAAPATAPGTGATPPPSAVSALPVASFATPTAATLPAATGAAQPSAQAAQRLASAVAAGGATAANAARAAADDRTTRAEGRGERPAYVPRSNAFGYAEGDTFTYRVIDNWTERAISEFTTSIDAVLGDGQLLANGSQLQMDPQGRIQRQANEDGSVSEFQPYQDLWWSRPQRGQRHPVEFAETFERADHVRGSTTWSGSASVGRARTLELPAGSFEVLPIESGGWFTETLANGSRSSGKWSRTVWYSTQLGHPVAIDIEDTDRLGALVRRERIELLHAQASRTPPPP